MTDNKIAINGMDLSPIKDGIITVTPKLGMAKGFNVDYEYHIDIVQGTKTVNHVSNVLNTKKDKANYTVSVMDLEPGTYKAILRLEYMYDNQHYINMYSSNDFTIADTAE